MSKTGKWIIFYVGLALWLAGLIVLWHVSPLLLVAGVLFWTGNVFLDAGSA